MGAFPTSSTGKLCLSSQDSWGWHKLRHYVQQGGCGSGLIYVERNKPQDDDKDISSKVAAWRRGSLGERGAGLGRGGGLFQSISPGCDLILFPW